MITLSENISLISIGLLITLFVFHLSIVKDIFNTAILKFNSTILVILIALIAIFFSIHSGTFSNYASPARITNSYNWFNPADVFLYALDQYKLNFKEIPEGKIDLDSSIQGAYPRKYTIVLDKTGSTERDLYLNEINSLKENIITDINLSCNNPVAETQQLEKLDIDELLLLTALKQLTKSAVNGPPVKMDILFYFGNKVTISPHDDDLILHPEKLCENLKLLIDFIFTTAVEEKKQAKYRKTNLLEIFNKLNSEAYLKDIKKDTYSNLYIISDFDHESNEVEVSSSQLSKVVSELNRITIDQINLIKINTEKQNSSQIQETLNIIRKNLNHLYYYEFQESLTYFKESPNTTISSIFSSVSFDTLSGALNLYKIEFPTSENPVYSGKLHFLNVKKPTLSIGLKGSAKIPLRESLSTYLLAKGKSIKVHQFSSQELNLVKDETVDFEMHSLQKEGYYLELTYPQSTFKVYKPIVLRTVLPLSSTVYLITFYSLFFVALISIIYLLTKSILDTKREKLRNQKYKWIYSILTLILLWPFIHLLIVCGKKCLQFIIHDYGIAVSGIVILYIVIQILLFKEEAKEAKEAKAKEVFLKNP